MFGAMEGSIEFLVQVPDDAEISFDFFSHIIHLGQGAGICSVVDGMDREIGYLIGRSADDATGAEIRGPAPGQSYSDWARGLTGWFLCYLAGVGGRDGAFLTGATGSLGIVYDPAARALASAPDLLFFAEARRRTRPSNAARSVPAVGSEGGAPPRSAPLRLPPDAALHMPDFVAAGREFACGAELAQAA